MSDMVRNPEENKRIDLLNRQEFVEQFMNIAEILAQNEKCVCYAIDGAWGIGKSFVLDMIEEASKEKDAPLSNFMIFRYNCWEYDYYDEPLMAIVAAMIDTLADRNDVFSEGIRKSFSEILKIIGKRAIKKLLEDADKKTGGIASEIVNVVAEGSQKAQENIEEAQEYDQYYYLKEALKKFQKAICKLSEKYPVMIIVDELDRCLPEYAIRVLERLHHIFQGTKNVQVVLSIDKTQLEHTVKQIFGEKTEAGRYLAKFFSFELKLDEGTFTDIEKFECRFQEYIDRFKYAISSTKEIEVKEFCQNIFAGIDMRSRIAIIDNCLMLHDLICPIDEKKDFVYMCIEIFLAVVKFSKIDLTIPRKSFSLSSLFGRTTTEDNKATIGLQHVQKKLNNPSGFQNYFSYEHSHGYVNAEDIWGALLVAYRCILDILNDYVNNTYYDTHDLKNYSVDFWKLQNSIF